MFVIGNNCCGGYVYNYLNEQYNNPFIWQRTTFDSMYYIMNNFDKINWNDYEFEKSTSKQYTFNIRVGNEIKIHYSHYVFDPNANEPIKDRNFDKKKYDYWMGDIRYCRIWELINEKYLNRTERMKKLKEDPVFIIMDDEGWVKEPSKYKTINDIINSTCKYKRIVFTQNRNLKSSNNLCKIIYVKNIYVHPSIPIREHLTEIKDVLGYKN